MSISNQAVSTVRDWYRWCRQTPLERRNDQYDRDTIRIIERLPENATCIDIGASNGSILEAMMNRIPGGTFHAFEARPAAAMRLQERFPQAEVHALALSNQTGTATFHQVVDNPGYSGLRRQAYPGDYQVEQLEVNIDRLDNVLSGCAQVDFIKIDVEGAEALVLEGAQEVIKTHAPLMVFEFGRAGQENYGTTPSNIYEQIRQLGLSVSKLSGWLSGKHALTEAQFVKAAKDHWYFVAHP